MGDQQAGIGLDMTSLLAPIHESAYGTKPFARDRPLIDACLKQPTQISFGKADCRKFKRVHRVKGKLHLSEFAGNV
jgi:hypothetical protein